MHVIALLRNPQNYSFCGFDSVLIMAINKKTYRNLKKLDTKWSLCYLRATTLLTYFKEGDFQ